VNGRTSAWERLGHTFSGAVNLSAEEVMRTAHLHAWNVRKMPVTSTDYSQPEPVTAEIEDTFGVWRDNPTTRKAEVLLKGTVGAVWDPFQNEEMCDFLDALTGSSGAKFESAGAIHEGRDVFVSMRLPETMLVGGIDPVDLYLTAFNNHTGKRALTLTIGGIRVFCANQQRIVVKDAQSVFKIRHTSKMRENALAVAREQLELSLKYVDALQAEADKMINARFSDADFENFLIEICGDRPAEGDASLRQIKEWEEEVGQLRHLFRDADTQLQIRNTRWGAYQAVTEYLDWYVPVPAKQHGRAIEASQVRAQRTVGDQYGDMKQAAYELLAVAA
jgi:phage/plasmid-like protein (TIGR03299 family)